MAERIGVPQDEDEVFVLSYQTARVEGKLNPTKLDEPVFSFNCLLSTKRLLNNAIGAKNIHADSTYKLNWQGYPVEVFGTTDIQKKFHLIAMGFSTNERQNDFKFFFKGIKENVSKIFGQEVNFEILISDAAAAIKNGFKDIFPTLDKTITCYFHVINNVKTKPFLSEDNKRNILDDIHKLHLCPSDAIFNIASNLFIQKWINIERDFIEYFKKQWLADTNKYWYEGSRLITPKTNNALESTNGKIKAHFHREMKNFAQFKEQLTGFINMVSNEYRDQLKTVAKNVDYTPNDLKIAYNWAKSEKIPNIEKSKTHTTYYIPSEENKTISPRELRTYKSNNWKTFDSYLLNIFSIWKVTFPQNANNYKDATCTCPSFMKNYYCKHILGMCYRLQYTPIPDNVKELEKKAKRGKPRKAGPPLTK